MKKEKQDIKKDISRKNKRWLIRLLGWITGPLPEKPKPEGEISSVMILAQEKLGDCILLTPTIRLLKTHMPDLEISLVCFSRISAGFFEQDPNISAVYRVKENIRKYYRFGWNKQVDVLFNTKDHPSFNFMIQTLFIKARFKVGIYHDYHPNYFNFLFHVDFYSHVIEKNALIARYLGISYSEKELKPYLPPAEIRPEIKELAVTLSGKKVIGLNLSAGNPDREWTVENWKNLISLMGKEVIVFAVGDRIEDKKTLEAFSARVIPSPDTKSIFEAGELISKLDLLITPDTSQIHVASCFGIPVCGLFQAGNLHSGRFYPYGIPYRTVQSDSYRVADIKPDAVWVAVKELLN